MLKVMCVGASPDSVNNNAILRKFVTDGFKAILGETNVISSPLEFSHREAISFHPNIILAFGSCMPDSCYYISLREYCNQTNTLFLFWLHDDPYEFDFHIKVLPFADLIFSNDRFASLHYPRNTAVHLPLAGCNSSHYRPVKSEADMKYDFVFCGVAFENRKRLIKYLDPILKDLKCKIIGPGWSSVNLDYCKDGSLTNKDFADLVNNSKFVLNVGRDLNLANSRYHLNPSTPGPRTFETALAGGLQIQFTEGLEILDYLRKDQEILLFDSLNEFKNIIFAGSEEDRERIRKNAQQKVQQSHTYENRAQKIIETAKNLKPS